MFIGESSVNRSAHILEDSQVGKLRLLIPVEVERINIFCDKYNSSMLHKFIYLCIDSF